jgi:hypothetical protein
MTPSATSCYSPPTCMSPERCSSHAASARSTSPTAMRHGSSNCRRSLTLPTATFIGPSRCLGP